MKLSLIRKIAIALAVALAVVLAVAFAVLSADWRKVFDYFGVFGMAMAVIVPIYLYINDRVEGKKLEEQGDRERDCVRMLEDLKQELPEYGNAIDFVIDEVQHISSPRITGPFDEELGLREKWVKLAKHPKLREKWLGKSGKRTT